MNNIAMFKMVSQKNDIKKHRLSNYIFKLNFCEVSYTAAVTLVEQTNSISKE